MAAAVPAILLVVGSAAYAAGAVLHGKGELVNQPLTGDLQVLDVQLEPQLVPGVASNLIVKVRNRSASHVIADRVRLVSPLRDAKPAGCLSAVSGPLLNPAGVLLYGAQQRLDIGPGITGEVVLPAALRLAAKAKNGCGFRVDVDIQAIAIPDRSLPPTTFPTSPPTTDPTPPTFPTIDPDPSDTDLPGTTPPTVPPTPPATPSWACDEFDPTCSG
ncbi:hypothetical protein Adu01nite_30430 [Paractinoplanes durhamensis]|uniref:Uncharacterized protein n=2 Tax=Paractinoplanes durhamensis TaxID=113563 RepID=A0ABQ3YVU2_9ACTN|nr:hypothetical protein Adu01nite_30430 [Actinoplanes durhamensis]